MGNTKNVLALIGSVLLVVVVLALVFVPISSIDVPGSYKDFSEKSDEAVALNDKKQSMLDAVSKKSVDVKEKQDELEKVTEASDKSKELFEELVKKQNGEGDWSYHVPSLLIRLEDAADKRNIKLAMDYDTFKADGKFVSDSKQDERPTYLTAHDTLLTSQKTLVWHRRSPHKKRLNIPSLLQIIHVQMIVTC